MKNLIHTLTGFATYIDADKTNTVCGIAKYLGTKLHMGDASAETFGIFMNYLFFAVSFVCFFLCRRRWQEALFLGGILVSFIPSNWEYTLVYYIPALLLFLKENNFDLTNKKWKDNLWIGGHALGFALVFSVNFFMIYFRYGLITGVFLVTYLMIGINMFAVIRDKFINLVKRRK